MLNHKKDSMRLGNMGIFLDMERCQKKTRPYNQHNPHKAATVGRAHRPLFAPIYPVAPTDRWSRLPTIDRIYRRPKIPVAYQMPFLPRFMS